MGASGLRTGQEQIGLVVGIMLEMHRRIGIFDARTIDIAHSLDAPTVLATGSCIQDHVDTPDGAWAFPREGFALRENP